MKNNYVDIEFNFLWSNTTCNVNVLPKASKPLVLLLNISPQFIQITFPK